MLKFLRIRHLATIEDISLDLADGFTVLTGETGAGKSVIIDSIRLVCGDKGTPDLVRAGSDEATVEAIFALPDGFEDAAGLFSPGDEDVVLRRTVPRDGNGKAYCGGVARPGPEAQGSLAAPGRDLRTERPHLPSPARKPSRVPRSDGGIDRIGRGDGGGRPGTAPPRPPEGGMDGQGAGTRPAARLPVLPDPGDRESRAPAGRRGGAPRPAACPEERREDPRADRAGARSRLCGRDLDPRPPGAARPHPRRIRPVRSRARGHGRIARSVPASSSGSSPTG